METGKLRILVADDHSMMRNGIINSIKQTFPNAEFGEAANASEIVHQLNVSNWNLIVLDISMPGRNGMEVLKDIKESNSETKVIIFSMYPEDQFAIRALKAGASAYMTKDVSAKELGIAIQKIINGGTYLTPTVAELMTNELRNDDNRPIHNVLSDREHQVFLMIASGKSVSVIAEELSLSVKTISVYRSNILTKMNLKNNSEITHYAFKNNLVE